VGPEAAEVLDQLSGKRGALLHEKKQYLVAMPSDLGGGRLLVSGPHLSVWDGASQHASAGFVDAFDAPPWDTWITVITSGYGQSSHEPLLVSWVPPQSVAAVDAAIDVNPVGALRWATDADLAAATAPRHEIATR